MEPPFICAKMELLRHVGGTSVTWNLNDTLELVTLWRFFLKLWRG